MKYLITSILAFFAFCWSIFYWVQSTPPPTPEERRLDSYYQCVSAARQYEKVNIKFEDCEKIK